MNRINHGYTHDHHPKTIALKQPTIIKRKLTVQLDLPLVVWAPHVHGFELGQLRIREIKSMGPLVGVRINDLL